MTVIQTKSAQETQKVAKMLAEETLKTELDHAVVIALQGDLGAGKTTFTQGFARALGIKENVLSPTFVILKTYQLPKTYQLSAKSSSKYLVHIDCYRFDSPEDLVHLGFRQMMRDKDAIILIEWADRIRDILPSDAVWLAFEHGEKPEERSITVSNI